MCYPRTETNKEFFKDNHIRPDRHTETCRHHILTLQNLNFTSESFRDSISKLYCTIVLLIVFLLKYDNKEKEQYTQKKNIAIFLLIPCVCLFILAYIVLNLLHEPIEVKRKIKYFVHAYIVLYTCAAIGVSTLN